MANITLKDVFGDNPESAYLTIQSFMAQDGDLVLETPFYNSGIISGSPLIDQLAAESSSLIEIGYWGDLDASVEPNYGNDVYEDVAIPHKLSTTSMTARKAYLNEAWGQAALFREIRKQDPLEYIAGRVGNFWVKQAENRIMATARGIYALENDDPEMNVTVAPADSLMDALIDAQLGLGDNFGAIDGYIMDSRTFGRLSKEKLAAWERDPDTGRLSQTYNGLPVIVSDRAMTDATGQSIVTLLGNGAFGYGMYDGDTPLEYEREASRGNGHGFEALWTRRNMIVHPLGYSFLSTSITGNGTETVARSAGWADLINPENWRRDAARRNIPLAFVTVANP